MNHFDRVLFQTGITIALCCFSSSVNAIAITDSANQSSTNRGDVEEVRINFNDHIAPIIFDKCSSCHRPGQNGPFSLLTYNDVKKRAATIDAVIDDGYMPPWKPRNHNVEFSNDRSLTSRQKKTFKRWISDGMLKGDGATPKQPDFPDGWVLGNPDLVIQMKGKFDVPAEGPDIYRSFVFPIGLSEDKWIKAIEYRPSATTSVHHGVFFVDVDGHARRMDGSDGKAGISGMGFLTSGGTVQDAGPNGKAKGLGGLFSFFQKINTGEQDAEVAKAFTRGLGGYVPGTTPAKLPGDLAMHLPKGSDIVMQTHFHPSGKAEVESGTMALYFADKKPTKMIVPIQVPAMFGVGLGIKIPAGESEYKVTDSFKTPVDIQLVSVGAHAHYICRKVLMTATLPDGSSEKLLEIDDWDLDWQDRYYFATPIALPAGTVLKSELTYDNSEENTENPNSPPKEIRWGRESEDEMASIMVQVVAKNESERPALQKSLREYFLRSLTQGDIVDLLMQLDTNRDGGLQPSESPPKMSARFSLLDSNKDGKLDPGELQILRRLMSFGNRRNKK